MKVIQLINDRSCVLKLSKREFEIVQWIIVNDDTLDPYFDVVVHSDSLKCVVTEISNLTIDKCIEYFNHCFAIDMVESMIRFDKIGVLKSKI